MPTIYLVRHGEADGERIHAEGWWGPMRDFAPLTARGVQQAQATGREIRRFGARRIIASPMTRALQTASLIAAETRLPLTAVEFDLREWLPDSTLTWKSLDDVEAMSSDRDACGGEWPTGETRQWEPLSAVRRRALAVLQRQVAEGPESFIAVCHGIVIQTLTGQTNIEHAGIRVFDISAS